MYNYLAEFIGSAFFVYIILATQNPLAIGAALALVILLSDIATSGYANPAVTIVMASMGKLPVTEIIPYVIAQIFGALIALEVYKRYRL